MIVFTKGLSLLELTKFENSESKKNNFWNLIFKLFVNFEFKVSGTRYHYWHHHSRPRLSKLRRVKKKVAAKCHCIWKSGGLKKKKGETALGPSKGWPTRFSRSGGHGRHIKKKELKKKRFQQRFGDWFKIQFGSTHPDLAWTD